MTKGEKRRRAQQSRRDKVENRVDAPQAETREAAPEIEVEAVPVEVHEPVQSETHYYKRNPSVWNRVKTWFSERVIQDTSHAR